MKEPTLIVMAAGMGSRYGGLKQIDPVGDNGEIILDFSLYDACKAGFKKAVFIIKEEMEDDFRKLLDNGAGKHIEIQYAFQKITDIPEGFSLSSERKKPWGTAHAVMSARHIVDSSFAVINADDFYGYSAFKQLYDFLNNTENSLEFCMIGYLLKNTVTENGSVSRGLCTVDNNSFLKDIVELTKIEKQNSISTIVPAESKISCMTDDNEWMELSPNAIVSMNCWGFTHNMMNEIERGFPAFLNGALASGPKEPEYFLPAIVDNLIKSGATTVKVLKSSDKWYGVTYKEDKSTVSDAILMMKDKGIYPHSLWD